MFIRMHFKCYTNCGLNTTYTIFAKRHLYIKMIHLSQIPILDIHSSAMWIIYGRFGESSRYVTFVLTVPYAILHHVVVRYKCISDDDMSTFIVAVKQACYCNNDSSSSPDSHFNYNKQCGYHGMGRQWIWIKTYLPWNAGEIDIEVLIMHHILIRQYVRYKPILIADDRKNRLPLTVLHQVSMLVDTHKDWEIKKQTLNLTLQTKPWHMFLWEILKKKDCQKAIVFQL